MRFLVLTAASMKMIAFWDVWPSSLVEVDRRFRVSYCLHHHHDENRKAVPQHTYGGVGGRGDIAPTHSQLRHLMGGVLSASRPGRDLPPGKGPRYPLDRRLGGSQSWSGHRVFRKNPLASAGDRTSIARSSSL
jgi:hypothetical protein